MDLTDLTITEASRLIRSGEISPVELAHAYLDRIEKLDSRLNCFITVTPDAALQQASQAEQAVHQMRTAGQEIAHPLLGIPIAVKDLYETRGVRTTAGSKFFADYVPAEDAAVIQKLYAAGAVLLGKLNMHEIALGVTNVNPHFGACRNPWDLNRVSGGSSGGSGAALAAKLCLGSLGSDTGGSIRIPASLCGVVGLKPTYGRVSLRGVLPLSWNLDHTGPLARCAQDAAILLNVIAGYDPEDPASCDIPTLDYLGGLEDGIHGWRLALAGDEYFDRCDAEVLAAVQEAVKVFEQLGARVIQTPFLQARQAAQANGLMTTSDAATFHRERLQTRPMDFGEDVLQRLQAGAAYTSSEYALARRTQAVLRRRFEQFFDEYDLLLMPSTPVTAPLIQGTDAVEQARRLTRFTAPFNLTGLPALSLLCGFTTNDLPIGLQIVGRPWAEAQVLRAGYAYEQASEWRLRRPKFQVEE